MFKRLSDQVVVIVGASSGIGRAACLAFAQRGSTVVCAARSVTALETLVEEIRSKGGTAVAVPTDVADSASVQALADVSEQRYGRIDTWINTAAVGVWGRVEDITAAEFDRVMRVNFLGHVHGMHAALPALRRAGGGALIGISSVEGVRSVPLQAPYAASKFAVRALYDSLRMELVQEGVRMGVTTILPASIATPFFEHARSKLGAMVKPPPPVYAPQVVAETLLFAARHPRREIAVGGAAAAFILAQRLSPGLVDAVFSLRRLGVGGQRSDRSDLPVDNIDTPIDGPGHIYGTHPGRVLRHSPFTNLIGRRRRAGELLTGAIARLHRATAVRSAGRVSGSPRERRGPLAADD